MKTLNNHLVITKTHLFDTVKMSDGLFSFEEVHDMKSLRTTGLEGQSSEPESGQTEAPTFHQLGALLWRGGSPLGWVCQCGPHTGRQGSVPLPVPVAGCLAHCKQTTGRTGCPSWVLPWPLWRNPQGRHLLAKQMVGGWGGVVGHKERWQLRAAESIHH